jgi:hypothetical protein
MRYQVSWFATIRVKTDVDAPTLDTARKRVNEVLAAATQQAVETSLDRNALNDGLTRRDVCDIVVSKTDLITGAP